MTGNPPNPRVPPPGMPPAFFPGSYCLLAAIVNVEDVSLLPLLLLFEE